jgi:hypothetical protein
MYSFFKKLNLLADTMQFSVTVIKNLIVASLFYIAHMLLLPAAAENVNTVIS